MVFFPFSRPKVWTLFSATGLISIILLAQTSLAAVSIKGVENASQEVKGLPAATATIFGGLAGSCTGSGTPGAPCNSCATASWGSACNLARIYDSLYLIIKLTADKDGTPAIAVDDSSTPSVVSIVDFNQTSQTYTKGSEVSIFVKWQDICVRLKDTAGTSPTGCPENPTSTGNRGLTGTLRVGIDAGTADGKLDTNDDYATITFVVQKTLNEDTAGGGTTTYADEANGGIYQWEVISGDAKATLRQATLNGSNLPLLQDFENAALKTQAKYLRVFYLETTDSTLDSNRFTSITPASLYQDLDITSDAGDAFISPRTITGLTNGTATNPSRYYFRLATVDQAGNVGFYTPPDGAGSTYDDQYCTFAINSADYACHSAQPGEVVGVLSEQMNCFIATAAYGSSDSLRVEEMRHFRDKFLLPFALGKSFVSWYYRHSPKWAETIRGNENYRKAARVALGPAFGFAWLSLKLGVGWAAAVFISVILVFFVLMYFALLRLRIRRTRVF